MAFNFLQRAGSRREKCPDWDHWDSWLFLMQHFRLPTRLLDWTASPLVAAYFSVNERPSDAANLWALSPTRLNKLHSGIPALLHPRDGRTWPIFEGAFKEQVSDPKFGRVVAVAAQEVDLRMLVQLSRFTIHGTRNPIEELRGKEEFLMRFEIPASSKQAILDDLTGLGITQSGLFPDLEHLARELASAEFPPKDDKPSNSLPHAD